MEVFATLFGLAIGIVFLISPFLLFKVWKQKKALESGHNSYKERIQALQKEKAEFEDEIEDFNEKMVEFEAMAKGQNDAVEKLSNQFINDSLKFICSSITANNYESSVKKAEKVFATLRKFNIEFPESDEKPFYSKVKEVFDEEVKKDEARREQALIKEKIRDEQKALKEREDEIKRLERQTESIYAALEKAKRQFKDEHTAEVEELKRQLAEAQSQTERAKSQAELTKAGFVYVVSNIGSFDERVFKVGMTRRLEPMDRVKELSDASVPFPFDVHMMISCEDAPSLETNLHRDLHNHRLNKVNMHKEFFSVDLEQIAKLVEKHYAKVEYRSKPEAFEYYETKIIEERGTLKIYDSSEESDDDKAVA